MPAPLLTNTLPKSKLEGFLKRIEKLVDDRKAVSEDIREVLAEAKATGFDTKMIKEMLKLRSLDKEKRVAQEELRDLYLATLDLI